MSEFERRQMIPMLTAFGAVGAYGLCRVIAFGDYAAFSMALGFAAAISFALSCRDQTGLLRPLWNGAMAFTQPDSARSSVSDIRSVVE